MTQENSNSGDAGRVGGIDRFIRLVLAVVLIGFALFCPFAKDLGTLVVWGSGILGVVLFVTALIGRCPLYRAMGIRT